MSVFNLLIKATTLFFLTSFVTSPAYAEDPYLDYGKKKWKQLSEQNKTKRIKEAKASYKVGSHILGISGDVPRAIAEQMYYHNSIRKGSLPGELSRFGKLNPPSVSLKVWETALKNNFGAYAFIQDEKVYKCQNTSCPPSKRAVSLATLEKIEGFMDEIIKNSGGNIKNTNPNRHPAEPASFDKSTYNMHLINKQFVIPLTYKTRSSLAGFVGGGNPTYFISHNWSGSYKQFMTSVRAHFKQKGYADKDKHKVFYWVCTFANNQWSVDLKETDIKDGPFPNAIQSSPFAKAINLSKEVVSIEDTDVQKLTFERSWCVAEMYQTVKTNKPLSVACGNGGLIFKKSSKLTGNGKKCPAPIQSSMKKWTFLKHKASVEQDRKNILKVVCGKGFDESKKNSKCISGSKIEKMIHAYGDVK